MKNIEQLKKYLDDLVKLETEKYRLEEIKRTLLEFGEEKEKEKKLPNTKKESLIEEKNFKINNLKSEIVEIKNKIAVFDVSFEDKFGLFFKWLLISVIPGFFMFAIYGELGGLLFFVFYIGVFLFLYFNLRMKDKEEQEKLKKSLSELELSLDERISKIEKYYEPLIMNSISYYDEYKNKLVLICDNNVKSIIRLDDIYNYTVNKLNELYNLNIIFEKYRNLAAVTMFYEYFASSRVFELEGKDGAYNLYEIELRQNLIINNLSQINVNLEQIKDNQYCMYKELTNVNSSLKVIDDSLNDLADIEKANMVVNLEIAKNTSMMKNIQLYNFIMDK